MSIERVGIDLGKSSCKYASRFGIGEIPSYISRGTITEILSDPQSSMSALNFNNESWLLGDTALLGNGINWRTDEEKGDERSLLFILLVLARLGITNAEIVVGLPVAIADNKRKVESIKQMLSGEKKAVINGKSMIFEIKTHILAEPIGTFFSLNFDEKCQPIKSAIFADQTVNVIVDIGHRTVDVVTIRGRNLGAVKGSTMSGLVTLFENIWKNIEAEYGVLQWSDKVQIYHDVVNNFGKAFLKANGQIVHPRIWDLISILRAQLARDIVDEIKTILSNVRPSRILVTGGGGLLLKDDLLAYMKHLSFVANARFSNVKGFYISAHIL